MTTINKNVPDLLWENGIGFARLKGFLNFLMLGGKVEDLDQEKYAYLLHYASRYGLLDQNNAPTASGSTLSKTDPNILATTIAPILKINVEGHGGWIFSLENSIQEGSYVFESIGTGESSYEYALFLSDLGIICESEFWKQNGRIFTCTLTDCGHQVVSILKPLPPDIVGQPISDNEVPPVTHQIIVIAPGGQLRQNFGKDMSTTIEGDNSGALATGESTSASVSKGGDDNE